jgi:predicted transposase YdaD
MAINVFVDKSYFVVFTDNAYFLVINHVYFDIYHLSGEYDMAFSEVLYLNAIKLFLTLLY